MPIEGEGIGLQGRINELCRRSHGAILAEEGRLRVRQGRTQANARTASSVPPPKGDPEAWDSWAADVYRAIANQIEETPRNERLYLEYIPTGATHASEFIREQGRAAEEELTEDEKGKNGGSAVPMALARILDSMRISQADMMQMILQQSSHNAQLEASGTIALHMFQQSLSAKSPGLEVAERFLTGVGTLLDQVPFETKVELGKGLSEWFLAKANRENAGAARDLEAARTSAHARQPKPGVAES